MTCKLQWLQVMQPWYYETCSQPINDHTFVWCLGCSSTWHCGYWHVMTYSRMHICRNTATWVFTFRTPSAKSLILGAPWVQSLAGVLFALHSSRGFEGGTGTPERRSGTAGITFSAVYLMCLPLVVTTHHWDVHFVVSQSHAERDSWKLDILKSNWSTSQMITCYCSNCINSSLSTTCARLSRANRAKH